MKPKLLCILHRAPPAHGSAEVGGFIASSEKLKEAFECRFITIKSSNTIGDIGKVNFKKFYLVAELYVKVLWALLVFQPQKLYFTASIRSVALYRDLLVSTLWKAYGKVKKLDVYYHYHTKGVNEFISRSEKNLKLTQFFVKGVNLLLLSPLLAKDFDRIDTYKSVSFLPNGVANPMTNAVFKTYITDKFIQTEQFSVLYLSNMIKSKGYFSVLELANTTKNKPIHYHFAGVWQKQEDKKEFFKYIHTHDLQHSVTFHGFVHGVEKKKLFQEADFLMFPTRYEAESFGLVIIEALSYGVPVISTDEGSIPYILDEKCGIVLSDVSTLPTALKDAKERLLNERTAKYCRQRYLKNFSLDQFENNLVTILRAMM